MDGELYAAANGDLVKFDDYVEDVNARVDKALELTLTAANANGSFMELMKQIKKLKVSAK